MVRSYCFVPGCKTGYSSDRKAAKNEGKRICSLFAPPSDVQLFNEWQRLIPRADTLLTKNDSVCELHFLEEEVERYYVTKLPDGTVHKLERGRPLLKLGAVPTIFPNLPAYSKILAKRKRPASHNPFPKMARDNSAAIVPQLFDQNAESLDIGRNSSSDLEFDSISGSVKLLNDLWSVTSTADFIIYAKWNKQYTCEKRVVIEKDLTVKIYIRNREIDSTGMVTLTCLQDISSLLLKVDSFVVCAGVDDKAMSNCSAYVEDCRQFGGRLSMWCKECRKIRKREANTAIRNNKKKMVYCHKEMNQSQRLVCEKRKASRLQRKVSRLREEVQLLKKYFVDL